MKKLFTTLLILFSFYTISFAQQDPGTIQYGVTAGFNYSYVTATGGGIVNSGLKVGFNAGVSADYYFSEKWSLKIKALYDQKGWGNGYITGTDANGNPTEVDGLNIKLNYITIPVMASIHVGSNRQWYFDFGPYVGILTSASGGGYNLKSTFSSTDGGIAGGTGFQFPIGERTKFFIELESEAGVINLAQTDSGFGTLTNERTSLNIGINF
jgi:hypothetical protein